MSKLTTRANGQSSFMRLLNYGRGYQSYALKGTVFSVANKFFDIMPEILIGVAIDIVARRQSSFVAMLGLESPIHQMLALSLLTLVIWVSESIFEYLFQIQWQNLAQLVQHDLRMDAYNHMQRLDMRWFDEKHSGHLVSILNDDINQLERFLNGGANSILQLMSAIIFIGCVFFYLAWDVACVAILPIPLIIWGATRYKHMAEPLYAGVREKASKIGARLTGNILGIATIKAFSAESYESKKLREHSLDYVEANKKAIRVNAAFTPIIRMGVLTGFVGTLLLAGLKTLNGEMPVGSFGIMVFLTQRLLWPFTGLGQLVDQYQRAMASCDRIMDLFQEPVVIEAGGQRLDRENCKGGISFESVGFSYPGREPLFTDLNLEIPAGKTVAIVGATGSGKSTIAKLLLRFQKPDHGRISLDGIDIQNLMIDDLRSVFGFVNQDVYLFSDSIRNNIAYGSDEFTEDEIIAASKLAAADSFIGRLPRGYESLVGERGQKLSGGQRQRIGLARAIIRKPKILLLDEATSAVDNETERLIQESLEKIRQNHTVIVIAHRLSTVRRADWILVMDEGQVIEQGAHEALLANKGSYFRQLGIG